MVGGWRLVLVIVAGLVAAVAGTVLAVAVIVATGGMASWFPSMDRYPLWWTAGATAGVAGAGLLVWQAQRVYERGLAELVPAVERPERWVVGRPGEVGQVVAALRDRSVRTVGGTTAVLGAGGFGKTTIAKMVRANPRVLREFRGRVYWVSVGRDVGKPGLALLVNGLIERIDPGRALTAPDAVQAGEQLAAVLASGPRRLLVLDDVWTEEQLAAFPLAGRCARLVTTRNPSLAAGASISVRVDRMSGVQARALLLAGLQPLPATLARGLVQEAGRWPLLLRLANKILADQARLGLDVSRAAGDLLARLREGGGLVVDELTGAAARQLDINDPDQRGQAVRATIEASTGLLSRPERDRLAELAVFAEDRTIPIPLITILWQATSGLDTLAAAALCARLADLALLTLAPGGTFTMHDVIRDYLREQLGTARIEELHQILLDSTAKTLPVASAMAGPGTVTAWWELPEEARYLREHLAWHLLAAGRNGEAEQVAGDLRWVDARLRASGPAGPYADLAVAGTLRAARLRRMLGQAAHLLAPTEPVHSLTDIMYCRVSHDPDWAAQAAALSAARTVPRLTSVWPPPDLPSSTLIRTLLGHDHIVFAVAVAPDGTWLATASLDQTARIWDTATGQQRVILTGHDGPVTAVAVAPDGTWVATASSDRTARIWDTATGQQRAILARHDRWVTAVAVAPDGTWLATASSDRTARIWDIATGQQRAILTGHNDDVSAVAVAPDGTWLATASYDRTVRIWDTTTGQQRAVLARHDSWVTAVAVAPDGTWLTTASSDGTARIWDTATGHQRTVLAGHVHEVWTVAVAPDGTWLATGGHDRTVRIWDTATGYQRGILVGHDGPVYAVTVAPDGTWLATASHDRTVRIWDPADGSITALMRIEHPASACTWDPAGDLLAVAGNAGPYLFAFKS
jgi:WD40 repeat protein